MGQGGGHIFHHVLGGGVRCVPLVFAFIKSHRPQNPPPSPHIPTDTTNSMKYSEKKAAKIRKCINVYPILIKKNALLRFSLHVRQHENYKKWVGSGMIVDYTKNSLLLCGSGTAELQVKVYSLFGSGIAELLVTIIFLVRKLNCGTSGNAVFSFCRSEVKVYSLCGSGTEELQVTIYSLSGSGTAELQVTQYLFSLFGTTKLSQVLSWNFRSRIFLVRKCGTSGQVFSLCGSAELQVKYFPCAEA